MKAKNELAPLVQQITDAESPVGETFVNTYQKRNRSSAERNGPGVRLDGRASDCAD